MINTNKTIVDLYKDGIENKQVLNAKLVYQGGPLLTNVCVVTLFWGTFWQDPQRADLVQYINNFFDTILTSPLMDQLSEYNVNSYTIGYGKRIGTLMHSSSSPIQQTTDQDIQQFLQQVIAAKEVPPATPNTLYFIYTPTGVTIQQNGSASCSTFCGYHQTINNQIFYPVLPYPDCKGCVGNLTVYEAFTTTSSHELCEAITDPIPGQGWYDQTNGEIGDICAWKTKQIGLTVVQQEWSNKNNTCI